MMFPKTNPNVHNATTSFTTNVIFRPAGISPNRVPIRVEVSWVGAIAASSVESRRRSSSVRFALPERCYSEAPVSFL